MQILPHFVGSSFSDNLIFRTFALPFCICVSLIYFFLLVFFESVEYVFPRLESLSLGEWGFQTVENERFHFLFFFKREIPSHRLLFVHTCQNFPTSFL